MDANPSATICPTRCHAPKPQHGPKVVGAMVGQSSKMVLILVFFNMEAVLYAAVDSLQGMMSCCHILTKMVLEVGLLVVLRGCVWPPAACVLRS